jgi:Mn-dependent DtxR family transcriptional regulator
LKPIGEFVPVKTHESGENYLETILMLRERNSEVRSIDIANEMGFSRPSISRAVKVLRKDRCIDMDGFGKITLTEKGETIARRIYNRHLMLTRYLASLGVSEKVAADDACRLEHVLSEQSFVKMVEHYKNVLSGKAQPAGAGAGVGAARANAGTSANPGVYADEYIASKDEAGAGDGANVGAGSGAEGGAGAKAAAGSGSGAGDGPNVGAGAGNGARSRR